jgi:hypothetical protein
VLPVVAQQVVEQRAHGQGAVLGEVACAVELGFSQAADDLERLTSRVAKRDERVGQGRLEIAPLDRQRVAVDRHERRVVFREQAADAHVVAVRLDVAQVAHVLDRGERLTRRPAPGLGTPSEPRCRKQPNHALERVGGLRQSRDERVRFGPASSLV